MPQRAETRSGYPAVRPLSEAENPARRQTAHLNPRQNDLIARAQRQHSVGTLLGHSKGVAGIQLQSVPIGQVEIEDPVDPGSGEAVKRVRAGTAGHSVGTEIAGNEVCAIAPGQDIVTLPTTDRVGTRATIQGITSEIAVDQVIAGVAEQHVTVLAADHPVIANATGNGIGADVAIDVVERGAADDRVIAVLAPQVTAACTPIDGVVSRAGEDGIVTGVAGQFVCRRIAVEGVCAEPADRILDPGTLGNSNISGQAPDIGEKPFPEVDQLCLRIAREIKSIATACVPDGENQPR